MSQSLETPWIRRTKWLTQALIISGTLNIGLLATFVYFVLKDKQESLVLNPKPPAKETVSSLTNSQLLSAYSVLPYQELILRLENKDLIEEGLTRRDLALSCLVEFHHFNLEKALGGMVPQKRQIFLNSADGSGSVELAAFPGLTDAHYQALMHYARTEKWPLTSQGLFAELKRSHPVKDASLIEAFTLTPEYHAIHSLFSKTGLSVTVDDLIGLVCDLTWNELSSYAAAQRQAFDLSPEARRHFLLTALTKHSAQAAHLLLHHDLEYALKRLDDSQILIFLDSLSETTPELEAFAKELLASPRTDPVWKKAAQILYLSVGEPLPEPYDHSVVIRRFLPSALPSDLLAQSKEAIKQAAPKKIHIVEPGDSLWKIARKYGVSINEIMQVNHLETERLRTGRQLEIPESKEKRRA